MNPRQIILEEARRAGVDPAVALSIWEQESGGSTDLGLRGPVLPKGKWKGHYARGPWQIMSFHGDIPNDFRGQTRWAMQHLKERGVRGYYGTGNPVVPGHPTTDQYEAEVLTRAGKIDPRTASTEIGAPAVSPHNLPSRSVATPDTYPSNLGQQVLGRSLGLLNPQPRERRLSDDLMAMGLGILNSKGGNWFGAGLEAMRQDRQAAQQQAIDRQRANAYNAQTMLHALNQMGYSTPDVYEQSRSREPTTFFNPQTGELISGFVNRLTAQGEDYEGNPIPSSFIDVTVLPQQAGEVERGGRDEWVTAAGPDGPVTVRESEYDPAVHGPMTNTPSYKDVAGGGDAKADKAQRAAEQVITNIDQTLADINANPWTASTFAPIRGFVGKVAGSAADEFQKFGLDNASKNLRAIAESSGSREVSAMDFRLTNAVTDAARYIINKGDPRMSNYDVEAAKAIMNREGVFKDSETTKQALMELRSIIGQVAGTSTPPSLEVPPPQETGLPPGWSVEVSP
ncbi:internal virion protein with endolysin domain [Thiohalocapsa phage LS06-2018-MD04]|nr:internal virion protein with endolysin domain [Thiohalocapsa phage LS06-2018-MD04]